MNKLFGRSTSGRNWRSGFTLIELLVVVLIIGILSAVALPQYQKSVDRARLTEVLSAMDAVRKGVDLYRLENGAVTTSANSSELLDSLVIELPKGFAKPGEEWNATKTRAKFDSVHGYDGNYYIAVYVSPRLQGWGYSLSMFFSGGKWQNFCQVQTYDSSKGKVGTDICQYLRSIGWMTN